MTLFIYKNNASSVLASGITNVATSLTVSTGTGSLFAAPSAGQQVAITLEDTAGNIEVVYCTGVSGDTLTVVRAQEGTAAAAFASGSRVEERITQGMLQALLQKNGGDTLTGTTTVSGILALGSGGSIQGGEVVSPLRGAAGLTTNQISVPAGGGNPTAGGSVLLTTSNLTGNLPSGFALAQTNMVVLWAGSSGSIPGGWHLCDGTTGTPDLRDKFIVGAGNSYALGATGGSAVTTTGSTDPVGGLTIAGHVLVVAELPAHTHNLWSTSGGTGGQVVDAWDRGGYTNGGIPITGGGGGGLTPGPYASATSTKTIVQNTGSDAAHSHGLSGNLAHTHSYSLPPYYGLFYIMKL